MFWKKYSHDKIKNTVLAALKKNADYRTDHVLGVPGSNLDDEVFYDDAPFIGDAPFLSALVANPNHIGCHTLNISGEEFFSGTQEVERELISICAEQIFAGDPGEQDGYVASGGTEANIQAIWIYRNYFKKELFKSNDEIAILCSEDSHYSMFKAADLLNLKIVVVAVDEFTREMKHKDLENKVEQAVQEGISSFIVVANMATTMFGSVDDIDFITNFMNMCRIPFKLHVDAAFGGFIYPFTNTGSKYTFKNPYISSITIDGHKMLQAPYGTGIFLCRKGLMNHVCTSEASYVQGLDYTLCGSRSGANAISVWMILRMYGSEAWRLKMQALNERTSRLCSRLASLGISFYRNSYINIVTIDARYVSKKVAGKYHLVSDTHDGEPVWYKIVVMPHVRQGELDRLVEDLRISQEAENI